MSQRFDVAIAGAGLAGSSLALRLARLGVRVALIDGASFPREKICGEFLSPEAWVVFDRLGLSEDLARLGYQPIRHVRISTPGGRIIDAEFAPAGRPPGIGISRAALDNILVNRAREVGVVLIERTRVRGPLIDDGRVVGLTGHHPVEGLVEVRAQVTVAADGRHSRLVEQTGSVRVRSWFRSRRFGLKRHLAIDDSAASEAAGIVGLHLVAGGYVGTCRVEGGLTNLCALLPEVLARRFRGDLDRLAADHLGSNPTLSRLLASSQPRGPWKTVAGVRVESANPRLPGILYAGDCQGTIDPLGGQGMTMALLGAELLVPFITSSLVAETAGATLQRASRAAWESRFNRRITLCRAFHHALVHPGFINFASRAPKLAQHLLVRCFDWTRDPVN